MRDSAAIRLYRLGRRIREMGLVSRSPAPRVIRYGRRRPRRAAPVPVPARPPVRLEDAVDGTEVEVPGTGRAFLVRHRDASPGAVDPARLFFDIEATGLAAAPLFLIGVTSARDGGLETRQYLARTYAEEAAVVALFLAEAGGGAVLVSFNGKSYDLPFIRTRAALHRIPFALDADHVDLLHASRRRWGGTLPDCRLKTLETRVLGRPRAPDIPGRDIPDAYHDFVRTGDAADLLRILEHNRRDLLSLAELMARLEA